MRFQPLAGDTLLDPFEARNTDLSLRLVVRVEADAVASAPFFQADNLLLWVGTGEPNATASAGGCPDGVEFLGYRSMGVGGSALPKDDDSGQWMLVKSGQNGSGTLNLTVFQPARPGIGGASGFEVSVKKLHLKPSADGW
jgi:hypothetical protein